MRTNSLIRIAAYLIVGGVLIYETPALCDEVSGWDKAAQQMYDLQIELNQRTVSFDADLAIQKLRVNHGKRIERHDPR